MSERATLSWYNDGCRSVSSPVRRLPTELLAEIFDMCAPSYEGVISGTTTKTQELERVAKKYLLQLSQVCSHWHRVAMGTPNLWSFIVLDTDAWSQFGHSSQTPFDLLTSSLQRGGECPLTLRIVFGHRDRNERSVLKLLSEHSRRWRRVSMWIDPRSLRFLDRAKGNLGRLTFLQLECSSQRIGRESASDIFQIAPLLTNVALFDWHGETPILPWHQLSSGSFNAEGLKEILPQLSTTSMTKVLVTLDGLPIQFPPVSSNVKVFTVDLRGELQPGLVPLFQSLTLHQLSSFRFTRERSLEVPRWEQRSFLDFASRSSLQTSLVSLRIDAVLITDHELLECLAALPLLRELYITESDDDSHPAVLTDHLLQSLTRGSDESCLIPSLFCLHVTSRFTFHDNVFWDLVTSRTRHRRFEHPFELEAYWCGSREHGFSAEFEERLEELEANDGFYFTTGLGRDPGA
ncbi:hypothetical protein C8R46DRAFT_935293 [Mycena filopes]|nr:hypothetical protein C8R46DRAFT_935293 [Mycena filopes]